MIKTIYNQITGQILFVTSRNFDQFQLPQGQAFVPGRYDSETQYIDAEGQAQSIPSKPDDGKQYKFNWESKLWTEIPQAITEQSQRAKRDALLADIDKISATRYASLTTEQQQELQVYRQALLDVPQQSGFPEDVVWPQQPAWL